jgi:hypothetical protein
MHDVLVLKTSIFTVFSCTSREYILVYHWKNSLATEIPAVNHITNEYIVRDHTIRFNMGILDPLWIF